jgi:hypothetical protein
VHKKFCDLQRNPGYKAVIAMKKYSQGEGLKLPGEILSCHMRVCGSFCTYELILTEKHNKLTPESIEK